MRQQTHDIDNLFDLLVLRLTSKRNTVPIYISRTKPYVCFKKTWTNFSTVSLLWSYGLFRFFWNRRYIIGQINTYLTTKIADILYPNRNFIVYTDGSGRISEIPLKKAVDFNSYLINWSEGSEIPQLVGILSHRLTSWFPVLFKNIFWPFLMRRQTHDIDNWFDLLEFWRTSKRNRTLVAVACSTRPWSDYIIVTMMTIQRINRSKIKIELRITRWIHTSQILHTHSFDMTPIFRFTYLFLCW